ncbi:MAG: hypothetical protein ACRCYU_23600 [Nocardioides sp.]
MHTRIAALLAAALIGTLGSIEPAQAAATAPYTWGYRAAIQFSVQGGTGPRSKPPTSSSSPATAPFGKGNRSGIRVKLNARSPRGYAGLADISFTAGSVIRIR